MFVFMVLEHVDLPVGSRCTIIFEKSLGVRKHSWCMQFRGRSTDERNFDVRRHRGQSPSVIECHNLLGGCDTRLHLDFDPIGCDIYNPDRGQGLDRRFQTRRVWPEGALAPEGQTRLVWNRRSSPARGLDCSSHMNFKPFMFLSVIYFRCPLTFPHPGLVPAFPCFSHSLPYFGHSVR